MEGKGVWRWGKREIIYLSLHCHHQNDFCIKVGSDESHFNVSLTVRDKVTRECPQTTTFWSERRAEANSNRGPASGYQTNTLPLGQTASQPGDILGGDSVVLGMVSLSPPHPGISVPASASSRDKWVLNKWTHPHAPRGRRSQPIRDAKCCYF